MDKINNEDIRLVLNTKSLKTKIEEEKLTSTGHRSNERRQTNKECVVRKKNRKGRLTTWNNSAAERLKTKGLTWKEARKFPHDRKNGNNSLKNK